MRVRDWIDQDGLDQQANRTLLYDKVVSVELQRVQNEDDQAGLSHEVGEASNLKMINVRLDPPDRVGMAYLALVDSRDVRINDRWRFTDEAEENKFLTVKEIEPRGSVTLARVAYE